MITVTAEFDILPGKEDEAIATIQNLIASVDRNEPGNILYRWHRGVKDPNHVLVFEMWRDDDAVKAHREMPHQVEFGKVFATLFDPASVKINRHELIGEVRH